MGKIGRGLPRGWVAVASVGTVLLAGMAATTAGFVATRRAAEQAAGQLMDRYSDDLSTAITDQVSRYGETLTDIAYSVAAQSNLRNADFTRITAGLDGNRFPGATGVAFVVPAATGRTGAVQDFWRTQGAVDLTLRPQPGVAEHEFIIFDKTFTYGTNLEGTDLEKSPQAASVLRTARQSGALAISPAYHLLHDQNVAPADRQTSVVLATPISTGLGADAPDVFKGWVLMGLHGQDFLAQTLLNRTHSNVQATLADPGGAGTAIATVAPGTRLREDTLVREQTITVGQRRWHITVWPTTRVSAATRHNTTIVLAAGLSLTLMLTILTASLTGSRNRALDQVDRATAALREDIVRRQDVEAQLREREQQLHHLAFHDPLTGLANRLLFHERVMHAIGAYTAGGTSFAVLFIDLDGFKPINDAYGHSAGDQVLRVTADRLREAVRAGDTVARLGGDEFGVILDQLTDPAHARGTAERVIEVLGAPIELGGTSVAVSASIGIATSTSAITTVDDIVREADEAMYTAKSAGKGRYVEAGV